MKYEEIKVGESYEASGLTRKVIAKSDEHKAVMTIDEDGDVCAWNEDELSYFKPIKKELPESGLLVHKNESLFYRTGKESGYGFNNYLNKNTFLIGNAWSFKSYPELWKPATPEDEAKFIKLLEAEAEKRGLGVDAKIKGHAENLHGYRMNDGKWKPVFGLYRANNKNGRIFHKGIWAEPIKEGIVTPKNYSWVETYCNISSIFFTEKRLKELEDKVEKYSNSVHKESEKKKAWWRS